MDLKRKLAHLRAPRVAPSAATPRDGNEDERETSLSSLRRQMAAILEREPLAKPIYAEPAISELPFVRVETDSGPIYQHLERLRPSHHIGTIPVDAALAARAEAIALLALDPRLSAVDPARALFLDTETTGLGGSGTLAFLIGLASFDAGALVVEQLLLRTPSEEVPLLRHVARRIEEASFLVTFNGKAFDVPTLHGRYVMNRLPVPPERPHLDLLHVARRLHRTRIRSCTLKAVESEVLGFVRDADIDGADVAPRYAHFLRTGDESSLRTVVDHNAWDVVSMAALVGLYGEPLGTLHREDLVGLARTYRRARAFEQAEEAAEVAVRRGAGLEGLRVRGEIAKARGDRQRALADFEALAGAVDDPRARLELSKLYEHFVKEPSLALEFAMKGTGERPEAMERRRARLERKVLVSRAKG
jgi:uncharacterized protein YprB with RNaseH-like and TPR domain